MLNVDARQLRGRRSDVGTLLKRLRHGDQSARGTDGIFGCSGRAER